MDKERVIAEMHKLTENLPVADTVTQAKLNELVINTVAKCIEIVKEG